MEWQAFELVLYFISTGCSSLGASGML